MFSGLKIKNKLIVINLVSTLVIVLIVGGFWVYDSAGEYREYFLNRISTQGYLVANNSTAAVLFEDKEEVKVILRPLASDQAILSARIFRGEEEWVSESYRAGSEQEQSVAGQLDSVHEHINSLSFPIPDNPETRLIIQFNDDEIHDAVMDSLYTVLMMVGLALFIALTLSYFMQSSVTKPIQSLSRVAKQVIKSKSYSLRSPFYHPDEIGSLTQNFNEMLELVEQKDLHLEDTVAKRTMQLESQNHELALQIKKREQFEEAHRASEKKFEQAFMNAPIGMALVNGNKQITQHNGAFNYILNSISKEQVSLDDLIDEANVDIVISNFMQLIQGEISWFQREVLCFTEQDYPRNAILSFSAVRTDSNQFKYAVLQLQDITEAKKMAAELEYQAKHDALTNLPNRRVLKQSIDDISRRQSGKLHGLCILDLDQFKIVNDTCGHAAGDELLRQIGQVLLKQIHKNDLLVRLGGDEFGVVLYNCKIKQLRKTAEKIRRAVEQWEFNWQGQTFRVGVSIGAVIFKDDGLNYTVLMQRADAACFIAKDMGRNQVYIADLEGDENISLRQGEMQWVQHIHEALEKDLFVLHIQTLMHFQNHQKDQRYEVLIRLQSDKSDELIPPGAFMPAAERYGLSAKVDRWVVTKLIEYLRTMDGDQLAAQSYWVNLSGISLGDANFLRFLEVIIKESGLPKGVINFEITETAVMNNIRLANVAMNRLIKLGCRFALDDFGSGVSSFGYLKQLPVSVIKIDGMFVRDILTDEIDGIFVKSIIDIAKVMGITTVAEFVESREIMLRLIEMGADYGQGFAIGKPQKLI